MKYFKLSCIILLTTILSTGVIFSRQKKISVGPNRQVKSIQEAVDAAQPYTIIEIDAGVYKTNKEILIKNKKRIKLKALGNVSIVCSNEGTAVISIVESYRVFIEGLHLTHKPRAEGCAEGVVSVNKSREIVINKCDINGCGVYGVQAYNTTRIALFNSKLHNNSWIGIYISKCSEVLIKNNIITNNSSIASFNKVKILHVINNRIYGNKKKKIQYSRVTNKKVKNNRFN